MVGARTSSRGGGRISLRSPVPYDQADMRVGAFNHLTFNKTRKVKSTFSGRSDATSIMVVNANVKVYVFSLKWLYSSMRGLCRRADRGYVE